MLSLNINSNAVVVAAAKLQRMGKSAFPVAVRRTLNDTALDVKRTTMIAESDRAFKKRKPTFFQATSRVEFAKGLEVGNMKAVVGFVAPANAKESGHATKDLEEQEHGGAIDKRAFIATRQGRTARGNVRDAFTMSKIKRSIVNPGDAGPKNNRSKKQEFVKSAVHAGVGGFILGSKLANGKRMLLRINSLSRNANKDTVVKYSKIYDVLGKRKAHVKATHFMERAAATSTGKMEGYFLKNFNLAVSKIK